MAYGLRVKDANGNVIFDSLRPLSRILLTYQTSGQLSGTFSVPGWNTGRFWWAAYPVSSTFSENMRAAQVYLQVSFSNGVVTWAFWGPTYATTVRFICGVY